MQIANNGLSGLGHTTGLGETQNTSSSNSKGAGASSSTSEGDGVQLSGFAGTLSKVLQSDSSSRSQRIAQLTAAVQSGTYQVDPAALSKAIVDHAVSGGNSL